MNMASDSATRSLAPLVRLFAGLIGAAFIAGASAQDRDPPDADDPPGRVGRLSEMTGQVWLYSPSAGEWLEATRNRPVTSGDRLATDGAARAELRIGSTTLWLDSGTELEIVRLDDSRIELYLHDGSVAARLRSREAVGEFELRTDEGVFRAQRTGRYRVDRVDEASHLTVISGQAVYEGPGSALTVYGGQRAEFWLDAGNAAQYSLTEPKRDAFAAWNNTRDRSDDRSASTRYVSPEMTGVEDLDRHGRWEQSDEYGALWIPRAVPVGWAPYSTGHWVWISPWGWTWVDDAPWGFAPFHYGRWVYYRSNWCWTPGTRVHRPVYAPALVAWVGGPRVSVSVSVGGPVVGWFPLAPREVYVPSYRSSPRYVREVNHTHVNNITHVTQYVGNPQGAEQRDFSNRKFAHAVTVVPTGVFTQRQPVAPAARSLRERHDGQQLTQELTRGNAWVAAPVTAPAVRQLEAQSITSPGIGGAPAPGRVQRPWGRADDERRSFGRPGQASRNAPDSPNLQNLPNAAISPAAPAAPAAPTMITGRPAVGVPPAMTTNPVRPMPQIGAPAPTPQAHTPVQPVQAAPPHAAAPMPNVAPPRQEPRFRTPRAPGTDVPPAAAVVRPDVSRPVAPAISAARPRPERPAEPVNAAPVVRNRPAEPQVREPQIRERGEQRQDHRRDGRDRSQAN
jgi:hypothetical protein